MNAPTRAWLDLVTDQLMEKLSLIVRSSRLAERLSLGPAAIVSPSVAARLLPWDDKSSMAFLRDRGLIRRIDGRRVVVWGDVVEAVRVEERPESPTNDNTRASWDSLPDGRLCGE